MNGNGTNINDWTFEVDNWGVIAGLFIVAVVVAIGLWFKVGGPRE
jgi:hypothetical protein